MSGQVGGLGEAKGARSAESAESRKGKTGRASLFSFLPRMCRPLHKTNLAFRWKRSNEGGLWLTGGWYLYWPTVIRPRGGDLGRVGWYRGRRHGR